MAAAHSALIHRMDVYVLFTTLTVCCYAVVHFVEFILNISLLIRCLFNYFTDTLA